MGVDGAVGVIVSNNVVQEETGSPKIDDDLLEDSVVRPSHVSNRRAQTVNSSITGSVNSGLEVARGDAVVGAGT